MNDAGNDINVNNEVADPVDTTGFHCPEPIYIDSDEKLNAAVLLWQQANVLAVDTEFMRTTTFYPYLGLVQLSDGEHCWLVDPLAEMNLAPLKAVLSDPAILKVFHSCSEDLEVLMLAFESLPTPIFDTQVAAGMAGFGFGLGYNKLLNELLGINLDKHQTRSDWLQRPLSDEQQGYAAEDVYYLFHVYPLIEEKLVSLGRQQWLQEDMQRLLANAASVADPGDYYLRVKGAWRLSQRQLVVLQKLCEFRENQAMLRNKPRGHIIKDDQLLDIVQQIPSTKPELAKVGSLHPGLIRRYGDTLLQIIAEAQAIPDAELPAALPQPLDKSLKPLIKQVKGKLADIAENEDFPRELLAAKKDIEQLIRHGRDDREPLPEKYCDGWRKDVVAKPLLALIRGFNT